MEIDEQNFYAKGNFWKRLLKLPLLYLAWFSPHKSLRCFFHKLRGVKMGRNVEIGYFCIIGNVHPYLITIEDEAVITARTTILDHDNSYYYSRGGKVKISPVKIGYRAFIGIGSVVMPGVTIGQKAIVGAMSFVTKDVPENSIVAGNPIRILQEVPSSVTSFR